MVRIYLIDTCIWMDFYNNRKGIFGKPIGDYATRLFMKILNRKDKILFSESLIVELRKTYNKEQIKEILDLLLMNDILIRVDIKKEEYEEARHLSKQRNLPFIDCLNAVQARNHEAILVSRDKHFFEDLKDIVSAKKPEWIS